MAERIRAIAGSSTAAGRPEKGRQPFRIYPMLSVLVALSTLAAGCARSDDRNVPAPADVAAQVEAARARLAETDGGRLVQRAIDAHGGLEAWYSAPTSSYTWEYANVGADLHFKSFLVADNRTR